MAEPEASEICPHCHETIPVQSKFCLNCGHAVETRTFVPPTPANPPQPSEDERKAILDEAVSRHTATGFQLVTRLDHRAEMASPNGEKRVYLEVGWDGLLTEQETTEPRPEASAPTPLAPSNRSPSHRRPGLPDRTHKHRTVWIIGYGLAGLLLLGVLLLFVGSSLIGANDVIPASLTINSDGCWSARVSGAQTLQGNLDRIFPLEMLFPGLLPLAHLSRCGQQTYSFHALRGNTVTASVQPRGGKEVVVQLDCAGDETQHADAGGTLSCVAAGTSCTQKDARTAMAAFDPLVTSFDDQTRLAQSTSRIALSGPLGQMQETRRNAQSATLPRCAEPARTRLVAAMNDRIDEFLAFAADQSDSIVQRQSDAADVSQGAAVKALAALTNAAGR